MALPWGVKENVDPAAAEAVSAYFTEHVASDIALDSGNVVKLLKGGVKEKKEKYFLIFRYQIIERPQ